MVKPLAWLALVALTFKIRGVLSSAISAPPLVAWGGMQAVNDYPLVSLDLPTRNLRKLAEANVVGGLLIVVDLSVLIYLHYLSHLGVFAPPT